MDDEDDLFDTFVKAGNANINNTNKEKEASLPIEQMKKLDIKDNAKTPQNQNQVNSKPATGGLKDLLSGNTNSNNTGTGASNTRERPRTTRGGRK